MYLTCAGEQLRRESRRGGQLVPPVTLLSGQHHTSHVVTLRHTERYTPASSPADRGVMAAEPVAAGALGALPVPPPFRITHFPW